MKQAKQLRRRLQPYRRMQLRVPKRMRDSFDEHQTIVDAILGGDERAAESCLKSHVLIQGERFTDFVALIGNDNATPKH
jgi:DNA-binding GntR family transcriptional regulator